MALRIDLPGGPFLLLATEAVTGGAFAGGTELRGTPRVMYGPFPFGKDVLLRWWRTVMYSAFVSRGLLREAMMG